MYNLMQQFNRALGVDEDNRNPYSVVVYEDYIVIYINNRCSWMEESGCTMCNYSCHSNRHASFVVSQYQDNIVTDVCQKITKRTKRIKIYVNGSFFADNELSPNIRKEFISKLFSKSGIKNFTVETRADCLSREKIEHLIGDLNINLEIAIGFESTNDEILTYSINKGMTFDIYKKTIKEIKDLVTIKGYLLFKPLLLTESEAIDDIIKSIKDLHSLDIKVISVTPLAIQKNTLVEIALQEKLYRPLWIWSIVELNTRIKALKLSDSVIKISGFNYSPEPLVLPFNCEKCSIHLWNLVKNHPNLTWDDIRDIHKCSCLVEWKNEINTQPTESLQKRFESFKRVYEGLISRAKTISTYFNPLVNRKTLTDIAKQVPSTKVAINNVGIQSVPLQLSTTICGNDVLLFGDISASVYLDEFHRGIHMSRLMEDVVDFSRVKHENLIQSLSLLSKRIAKSQGSNESLLDFNGYFIADKITIISKKLVPTKFPIDIQIINSGNANKVNVTVGYQIINACPCTKITNKELFNENGTHTQRGKVTLQISNFKGSLDELISYCVTHHQITSLLKREDELALIRDVYNDAQFCEDICREISMSFREMFFDQVEMAIITVVTDESIHPHNAFAQKIIN